MHGNMKKPSDNASGRCLVPGQAENQLPHPDED